MDRLTGWEAWVELQWRLQKDPETGLWIGQCEQLGVAAQGKTQGELEEEANVLVTELLTYLETREGVIPYFKRLGIEVQVRPLWEGADSTYGMMAAESPAPYLKKRSPIVNTFAEVAA